MNQLSKRLGVDVGEMLRHAPSEKSFKEELSRLIDKKGKRPINLVPVRYILNEEEQKELESDGIPPNETLAEIIQRHEKMSGDILRNEGLKDEAELAENHHNYPDKDLLEDKELNRSVVVGMLPLGICLADILHAADVEQALRNERYYKSSLDPVTVWSKIIDMTKHGKVGTELAYLWIKEEKDAMDRQKFDELGREHPEEKAQVERFLKDEEKNVWRILERKGFFSGAINDEKPVSE